MSNKKRAVIETHEDLEQDWDLSILDHPLARYSAETKLKVVSTFQFTGSQLKAAKANNVPYKVVRDWKSKAVWWKDLMANTRKKRNEELDRIFTNSIDEAMEQVSDRIKNGDFVRDAKTGELHRVPMKGKDMMVLGAIMYDKRSLIRGDATSITSRHTNPLETIEKKMEEWTKKARDEKAVRDSKVVQIIDKPSQG